MARENIENVLTKKGAELIARSIEQLKPIVFIKCQLGTYQAPDEDNLKEYTEIKEPLPFQDSGIGAVTNRHTRSDGCMVITAQYQNTYVTKTTYVDEIGLFAKLQGQDDSEAILFSYLTLWKYPDIILAHMTSTVVRTYDIPFVFNEGATVSVNITPGALVAAEDCVEMGGKEHSGMIVRIQEDGKLHVDIEGDATSISGHKWEDIAPSKHTHDNATAKKAGFESAEDKANLDKHTGWLDQEVKKESTPTFAGLVVNGYIDGAKFR